jgi:hypothetical protein
MAEDKTSQYINIGFKLVLAGVGIYAIKKGGEWLGLFKSEAESKTDAETSSATASSTEIQTGNPFVAFNPNYAVAIVKAYNQKFKPKVFDGNYNMVFSQDEYLAMANRLFDAKGTFDDNENSVYDVFRSITTQWQLSLLSSVFHFFKKADLLLYLKSFMNADEMQSLLEMVKNYPQYRKK